VPSKEQKASEGSFLQAVILSGRVIQRQPTGPVPSFSVEFPLQLPWPPPTVADEHPKVAGPGDPLPHELLSAFETRPFACSYQGAREAIDQRHASASGSTFATFTAVATTTATAATPTWQSMQAENLAVFFSLGPEALHVATEPQPPRLRAFWRNQLLRRRAVDDEPPREGGSVAEHQNDAHVEVLLVKLEALRGLRAAHEH